MAINLKPESETGEIFFEMFHWPSDPKITHKANSANQAEFYGAC